MKDLFQGDILFLNLTLSIMKEAIVCMVLCEGAFFIFFYMIITQVLIYKYLKQFIFNLNFMFALNFDTKYFFEFFI